VDSLLRPEEGQTTRSRLIGAGIVSGLIGGIALAVPLVIWDWIHTGHKALELPMAATAWLFGLSHFSNVQNHWWSIVLGVALFAVYFALSGAAFAGLADRTFRLTRPVSLVVAGAAWSFVSFLFFWYTVLPIARDGAPFRTQDVAPNLFVAANWVWILGFAVFGVVTACAYTALRRSAEMGRVTMSDRETGERPRSSMREAA
jgi:hypothetical protein